MAGIFEFLRHGPNICLYPGAFEPHPRDIRLPSRYGIAYEDITIRTSDKLIIRAYLLRHDSGNGQAEGTPQGESDGGGATVRPVVLMFHGNADNIGFTIPLAQVFHANMHCDVLMLSPRGYGLSEGIPSTRGLRRDCKAALDFIKSDERLATAPIVLYGQSMGGAFAIDLARRYPSSIAALIVENTYLSIRRLIPDVMPVFSIFAPFFRQWNSLKSMAKIPPTLPLLMLSGSLDEVIPRTHMELLWEVANANGSRRQSRFAAFPNGTHNDTWAQDGYWDIVEQFIRDVTMSFSQQGSRKE